MLERPFDLLASSAMPKSEGYFKPGEAHPNVKLPEARVRYIRRSGDSLKELARRFGVDRSAVYLARVGKTWSHLPNKKTAETSLDVAPRWPKSFNDIIDLDF